jgi:hypothetical protein
LLLEGTRASLLTGLTLSLALYGVSRAARARTALGLVVPLAFAYLFSSFWRLTSGDIREGLVHDAPLFLGDLVFAGTLMGLALVVRRQVGNGLAGLALGAFGYAVVARLLAAILSVCPADLRALGPVFEMAFRGASGMGRFALAAALVVVGGGLRPATRLPKPTGVLLGAAGLALVAVSSDLGRQPFPTTGAAPWLLLLPLVIGWSLSGVGLASWSRNGAGPAGWVGLGFLALQIPVILLALVVRADRHDLPYGLLVAPTFAGFGGIAITAFSGSALPLPRVRTAAACLILAGAYGGFLQFLTHDLLKARAPLGFAAEIGHLGALGLPLLAAYFAFVAAPPAPASEAP